MREIKSIAVYRTTDTAVFEVGKHIIRGEEKTADKVVSIKIGLFGKVRVELSNGTNIVFKGFPYSYEI